MQLSDAIELGSTMVKLDASVWLACDRGCGCLIGMGLAAIGHKKHCGATDALRAWPWLRDICTSKGVLPGGDCVILGFSTQRSYIAIISRMAVAILRGQMTMDAAIEWIRQHEPKPQPEPKSAMETPELVAA